MNVRALRFPRLFLAVLALSVASWGCGHDEPEGEGRPLPPPLAAAGDRWDSAGITIIESPGAVLGTPVGWTVDPVPQLVIGGDEQGPAYLFSRIDGVALLSGGGIAVVDEGSREVRWFDPAGVHIRSIGGLGSGPGQFRNLEYVPQAGTDSLRVFDRLQRRFTVLAADGSGHRIEGPPEGDPSLFQGQSLGAFRSGVLFRRSEGLGDCPSEGLCAMDLPIRWVDRDAGTASTVAAGRFRLYRTGEFGPAALILDVPFDPLPVAHVGDRGPFLTLGERFEIVQLDEAGSLARIMRIAAPPLPLEAAALERATLEYPRGAATEDDIRRLFAAMEIRQTLPTFDALLVDPLGWSWARRFDAFPEGGEIWVVFDPSGLARGVLEGPEGVRIQAVGEELLVGITTDPMGVERLVLHPFTRDGPR